MNRDLEEGQGTRLSEMYLTLEKQVPHTKKEGTEGPTHLEREKAHLVRSSICDKPWKKLS